MTKIQPGGAVENHNAANPSARLEAGDELLNVNGKPVTNAVDFGRAVALRGAGDVVAIIAPSAVPAGLMVRGGRGPAPTDQDVVAMLAGRSPSFASLQGVRLFGGNRCGKRYAAVVHHPAFQDLLVGRQILDEIAGARRRSAGRGVQETHRSGCEMSEDLPGDLVDIPAVQRGTRDEQLAGWPPASI